MDLSSCDKEPIRFPGSIQPHGFLLCLSGQLSVLQASDNLAAHTGVAAERAVGQPLAAVIGNEAARMLAAELHGQDRHAPQLSRHHQPGQWRQLRRARPRLRQPAAA
ncbi:hypothetical protein [Massilia eurypsychrophila]|uniref:hypothetical protein n=1 Tax=Massilia eurypsychrophila TaxID=1485217 RepID=UPI001E4EA8DA|nr:hypothetical protein [Massilia eurypsychrophila]